MLKANIKYYTHLVLVMAVVTMCSCSESGGTAYTKMVKDELAKGTRYDSLFMGMYFGMPKKDFFTHCWEMNKKGLFTNGSNNSTVLFKIDKDLKSLASMNFYPDFYQDKISGMRVSYQYDAWAPWNKRLFADSLFPDVLNMYKKWYPGGNDFIKITNKDKGTIYVKVDGNRRITIGQFNDQIVKVDYSDLIIEEKLKQKK